jgi:hypothetical protein
MKLRHIFLVFATLLVLESHAVDSYSWYKSTGYESLKKKFDVGNGASESSILAGLRSANKYTVPKRMTSMKKDEPIARGFRASDFLIKLKHYTKFYPNNALVYAAGGDHSSEEMKFGSELLEDLKKTYETLPLGKQSAFAEELEKLLKSILSPDDFKRLQQKRQEWIAREEARGNSIAPDKPDLTPSKHPDHSRH